MKTNVIIIASYFLTLLAAAHSRAQDLMPNSLIAAVSQEQQRGFRKAFEERLLATIPKEFSEPGSYAMTIKSAVSVQTHMPNRYGPTLATYTYGVSFEKPGDGWEPVVNADDTKVAYRAKQNDKLFVVVDNKRGPEFEDVRTLAFSPDGNTAYSAKQNDRWFIVVGERKGPEFDKVGRPVFSPDGSTLAYGARQGKASFIVINEHKGPEFDQVSSPLFSPDGKSLAYVAEKNKKASLMINGKVITEYDFIGDVTFSPDGSKIAYAATRGDDWFMVVDNKPGPPFFLVCAPTFSSDGSRLAYVALKNKFLRDKFFIVEGDTKSDEFGAVSAPMFAPNGNDVAYIARKSDRYLFVMGDRAEEISGLHRFGPPRALFDTYQSTIVFTGVENRNKLFALGPDGSKMAFVAGVVRLLHTKSAMFIGNNLGANFDEVGPPIFSPDGGKVGYWARQGRELWWKVVDVAPRSAISATKNCSQRLL